MRVLVTVASRHGGTREIGAVVADGLWRAGHDVDQLEPDEVTTVTPYDAVVLGSAVYAGRLGVTLRDLIDRQAGQLRERQVWVFWSGPVGHPAVPASVPDELDSIVRRTGAHPPQVFGGRLVPGSLNLSERALAALVEAEYGDFRDFDLVRRWTSSIVDALKPASGVQLHDLRS